MTIDLRHIVYADAGANTPEIIFVNADPSGVLEAPTDSIAINPTAGLMYVKTATSSTSWSSLGGGASAPDATATVKGILKLAGMLGGTADLPTVQDATAAVKGVIQLAGALGGTADTPTVAGRLVGFQILTSSGTYTRTAGATNGIVVGIGGGGGAGSGVGTTAVSQGSCGGSSGAYFLKRYTSLPATALYTIGAKGTGGAAAADPGNPGTDGGATIFDSGGTPITAPGGGGSTAQNNTTQDSTPGAPGAIATGGDINYTGRTGGFPSKRLIAGTYFQSGPGASSDMGAGGIASAASSNGKNGTGFGSGGSGASTTSSVNRAGGDGAPGVIIVWEYS